MESFQINREDKKTYPMGLTQIEGGIHISVAVLADQCSLMLFIPGKKAVKIPFPPENRMGNVWEMTLLGRELIHCDYALEADGVLLPDVYGRSFKGQEAWGKIENVETLLKTPCSQAEFDWEEDRPLHLPYESCVVYHAHVRGFTKHNSSGVKDRGTFHGVEEKIPYLKDLGITTLELAPVAEFQEVMMPKEVDQNPYGKPGPTGKLNYWGYDTALAFAPKASYSKMKDPVRELKNLVKALHRAGMELVVELFFDGKESPVYVLDAVRHWVREYHLDGVHLVGYAPTQLLAQDPYLADTKLWYVAWEEGFSKPGKPRRLGEYNEGFLTDMRRVLKGDEDQMNSLLYRTRHNPTAYGVVNYLANINGFTLMDLVSYDRKHNEANGEQNQDGAEYNYSWNCGIEGFTRKKKFVELRKKQIRNGLLLLFLSQGIPLLLAGDEFGNSQGGNNNAYCQDNETSWLNWNLLKTNQDLYQFTRYLIAFRKAHPVFHMSKEPKVMDYLACGYPDVSYHGVKAWCPEFENFRRQLGILYCGDYGIREDGSPDQYFFVVYNMHWEPHEFALPNLPKTRKWHLAFHTDDKIANGYYEPGQEPKLDAQKQFLVPSRSIAVLIGK